MTLAEQDKSVMQIAKTHTQIWVEPIWVNFLKIENMGTLNMGPFLKIQKYG